MSLEKVVKIPIALVPGVRTYEALKRWYAGEQQPRILEAVESDGAKALFYGVAITLAYTKLAPLYTQHF